MHPFRRPAAMENSGPFWPRRGDNSAAIRGAQAPREIVVCLPFSVPLFPQVGVAILFRKEASLAVVAALNQVQRHTVEVEAGAARHRAESGSFLRKMRAWPVFPLLTVTNYVFFRLVCDEPDVEIGI
jgi:hypothetical protein